MNRVDVLFFLLDKYGLCLSCSLARLSGSPRLLAGLDSRLRAYDALRTLFECFVESIGFAIAQALATLCTSAPVVDCWA